MLKHVIYSLLLPFCLAAAAEGVPVGQASDRTSLNTGLLVGGTTPFSQASAYLPGTLAAKLKNSVAVTDAPYNADATGATDATRAIQLAMNSLAGTGGRVSAVGRFKLSGNLTVPSGVTLEGDCGMPGSLVNKQFSPYEAIACGVLMVNSAATINMQSGASLQSLVIYRDGMTFPAPDSTAFAGTAITAGGHDVSVGRVLVMGFSKGFYSWGWGRTRIDYFYGDNNNGIEIGKSYDIAYISRAHQWPFATMTSGVSHTNHLRTGKAYYLHDVADWAKITDSFSWGYQRGFSISNASSVTLLNVGADNAYGPASGPGPLHSGSIGIEVLGNSGDTRIIGAQTAAQATAGVFIDTKAGLITNIIGLNIWGGSLNGVLVQSGDAVISGSVIRRVTYGVTGANTASRVSVSGTRFQDIGGNPVNASTPSTQLFIGENDYGNFAGPIVGGVITAQKVASAAMLRLPNSGSIFTVTGGTGITTIAGGWAGREVTLIFSDPLAVSNATGSPTSVRLASNTNFAAAMNSSLTLRHNGTQWYEAGRAQ